MSPSRSVSDQAPDRAGPAVGIVALGALVVLGGVPGLVLARVLPAGRSIPIATTSAIAAAAAVALASWWQTRRRPSGDTIDGREIAGGAIGALAGVGGVAGEVAVWQRGPAVDGPRGTLHGVPSIAVDALVHGWSALATSPVPADANARTLVPIAITCWLGTLAAVALARSRRGSITALLPGAIGFVLASVAAGGHPAAPVATGLTVLAASGAYLVVQGRSSDGGVGARRRANGRDVRHLGRSALRGAVPRVAITLAAALVAATVGPRLTLGRDDRAFDPRDHWHAPSRPTTAVNPLDLVTGRRRQPNEPMFTVRAEEAVRTRLVALTSFDGARWTVGAYVPTGSTVSIGRRSGIPLHTVRARIVVDALSGPWLPSFGDPVRVAGTSALVDPASGSFVATDGVASGATYTIDAEVADTDLSVARSLPTAVDVAATQLPPGLPAALRQMADVATGGATTPLARAALLERYLRLNFAVDDRLATGQSFGHLVHALTVARAASREEFAIAFAVLGRAVDLPTRLVVGFDPGTPNGNGTYDVRSGAARVWPEVEFDGVGWLPFDPVPSPDGADDPRTTALAGGARPTVTIAPQAETARPVDNAPDVVIEPPLPGATANRSGSGLWRNLALGAAIAAAALVLLAFPAAGAVVILKRRRTARRRRADGSREQVIGAWHDVLDRLVEAGVPQPRGHTIEELVEQIEPRTASLAGLYRPVSRALYDEAEPPIDDVAQAWKARDRFVSAMRRSSTTRRRLQGALDPRPLRSRPAGHRSPTRPAHSLHVGGSGGPPAVRSPAVGSPVGTASGRMEES